MIKLEEPIIEPMIYLLIFCIAMALLLFAFDIAFVKSKAKIETFSKCCNNTPCSDTYYSQEDNLCHLVLCENLYGKNNPKCVYPAK